MGRATQGAAYAMLGKAYIYQGKFQEAYDALMKVVESGEYSLEPVYADIFTLEHENGIESVFEIQQMTSNTGWSDDNEGSILSFLNMTQILMILSNGIMAGLCIV